MRGAILHRPGEIAVETRSDLTIIEPTDAIIRLPTTCICASDLWPYRGAEPVDGPAPMGHEYVGNVEEVGLNVTTVQPGQFVRIPLADDTLVITLEVPSADLIPSFPAASDVLGTGWFAADAAAVAPGKTFIGSTRPDGHIDYVGMAHDVELPGDQLFFSHVHLCGGPAPSAASHALIVDGGQTV